MAYEDLTRAEKALVDEYRGLRGISDWRGFSESQQRRKEEALAECEQRRRVIVRAAKGEVKGLPAGWERRKRRGRAAALKPAALFKGAPAREVRLPSGGCTPREKALIEEREMYFALDAQTEAQLKRKRENLAELTHLRKALFRLAQDKGWERANRRLRYVNLSIATRHGKAFTHWRKTHNPDGTPKGREESTRALALKWLESKHGITERPPGSNTDDREDGIRRAQINCAGGSGSLVCTPWCGEWCWRALDVAGVPNIGNDWMASVAAIEDKARRGDGPYRGWRSGFDTSGVMRGDQVVIGGRGIHVETVREVHDGFVITTGGNTSPGASGSQSNGGGCHRRQRFPGDVHGFALVDHVFVSVPT